MQNVPRLGSGIPLVARSRELDRLRAAFDRAVSGTASAVLVAGDAGVGKTRLTEEIASMARERGALVLTGRCLDAGETGLPYLPFAEALGQVRDRIGDHQALSRLLPEFGVPTVADPSRFGPGPMSGLPGVTYGRGTRPEQDVGQLQLFDAVHSLLGELAEQTPVV